MSNVQRIYAILDLLKRHTDEDRRLDAKEIADLPKEKYDISSDPRSIRRTLKDMIECGFPIVCEGKYYYRSLFTPGEMNYLLNGVRFGSGISQSERDILLEKLYSLKNNQPVEAPKDEKPGNPSMLENLAAIRNAMDAKRQITFHYGFYDVDGQLKISMRNGALVDYIAHPYGVVVSNGRYYMVAMVNRHRILSHYRVDRMLDIAQRKGKIRPLGEEFSLDKYVVEHPYMYPGEVQEFKIRVRRRHLNDVFDWFGKDVTFDNINDDTVDVTVRSETRCMEYWLARYGKIAAPIDNE